MPKTILLADDSVTIQKVIELTFMDEDYEVVSVGNGDEALDRLEEVTPDVVIADVHMPGASGYDVARRARQLHPRAPVLLLVGTFEPFDEGDYEACGASGFLKKPFDSQELLTRVGRLMAERPTAAEAKPAAEPAAEPAAAPVVPSRAAGGTPPWEEAPAVPSPSTEELPPPSAPPAAGAAAGAWATEAFTPPAEADETVDRASWAAESPAWDDEKTDPFRLAREAQAGDEPQPIAAEAQRETDVPDATATRAIPAAGREPELDVSGWQGSAWDLEGAESAAAEAVPGDEERSAQTAGGEAGEEEPSPWTGGWEVEEEPAPTQVQPPEPEPFPELAAPTAPTAPPPAPEAPEAAAGAAAPAPAAGGGRQERLSDEDVDRIARRVAELIGEPILREVAWEVVPDLAEVVIKDRLRELEAQAD